MHPISGKERRSHTAPHASAGVVVGLLLRSVRTPCGQSGSLRGWKLVPSKWRGLVPGERRDGAQSRPPAGTHRVPRKREPLGASPTVVNF